MGWGTTLYTSLYFSKQTFRNKYEVENALEEAQEMRDWYKEKIKALVFMTEPNKFYKDVDGDLMGQIQNDLNDYFDGLEETNDDILKLSYLLEEWDKCHDKEGRAICPPEDIPYDACYLHGDYIKMVYPDGTEVDNSI